MRVIKFLGDKKVQVEQVAMPKPGNGEVLVRVVRCALCGSDFKLFFNGEKLTGGHEILGMVEQPGHALHGKRCLVYIPVYCGECDDCKRGDTNLCVHSELMGWNRPGGYSEYFAAPEKVLIPVPDDIPDELAPLLLDAISTPAHGVDLAELVTRGQGDVLIMGAGTIGLGALLVCRDKGYKNIVVTEPRENRQARAKAFGACIRAAGDKSRRYKLVLECSGNLMARQEAIEVVDSRGAVVLLGENDKPWCMEENKIVRRKDFYMLRSFYFPKADVLRNAEILRRNMQEYRTFVDAQFSFDEFEDHFARFAAGELTKPLFKPGA